MKNTHIVRIRVEQAHYEVDEYGLPECDLKGLRVACIWIVKRALDCDLRTAKQMVEDCLGNPKGSVQFAVVLDDAGLGRVFAACWERDSINRGRGWEDQLSTIAIEDIHTETALVLIGG